MIVMRRLAAHSSNVADIFRAPLDKAIEDMWGFTSNRARHLSEGKECSNEEAEPFCFARYLSGTRFADRITARR